MVTLENNAPGSVTVAVLRTAIALAALASQGVLASDWLLNREPSSGWCDVQKNGENPKHGVTVTEHDTRKQACAAALKLYDPEGTAADKCSAYYPLAVSRCKEEGITLPTGSAKGTGGQK